MNVFLNEMAKYRILYMSYIKYIVKKREIIAENRLNVET